MNKGTASDIKPGMLVQIEVSSGPDKGIVYNADTDNFNVILLDNSGENLPACIGADEIICAWDVSQLPTYVVGDILIAGEHTSFRSVLENSVVYGNAKAEILELTLEEISEMISKYIGKSVSVSVKDSKPEGVEPQTEVFIVPEDGVIDHDAQIGEEFEIKGVRYRVIESDSGCDACALKADGVCGYYAGACGSLRKDGKSIIFERECPQKTKTTIIRYPAEIEVAVGECITRDGVTYRCVEYQLQEIPYCIGCALGNEFCADLECSADDREDGISVHFVKVSDTSEDACNSSDTADMSKDRKPTIAQKIHNLYEIEPAVGDIIEDKGKKLKVVESSNNCVDCYFGDNDIEDCAHIICYRRNREDKKSIILQEVKEEE